MTNHNSVVCFGRANLYAETFRETFEAIRSGARDIEDESTVFSARVLHELLRLRALLVPVVCAALRSSRSLTLFDVLLLVRVPRAVSKR